MKGNKFLFVLLIILLAFSSLIACSPQEVENNNNTEENTNSEIEETAPNSNSSEIEDSEENQTETEETSEEEIAEESEETKVGGIFTIGYSSEPDTLDPHRTHSAVSSAISSMIGTSLVSLDLEGNIIPYIATNWVASDDGLNWTFYLRDDVYFHNGSPLTAQDFVWTFQRAMDPETASPAAGVMLGNIVNLEAADDYTLVVTLSDPYYPFLLILASSGYLQPLSQSYFEEIGEEEFARNPIGTGPYMFSEWLAGEYVKLERNPDYSWGPDIGENTGSYYIETLMYRFIPEYATMIAGLETGEIDKAAIEVTDLALFESNSDYQVFDAPTQGIDPYMAMNLENEILSNTDIRKALNLALDRETMISIMLSGQGEIQYGPISKSVIGYWSGVEEIGYGYDPDLAAEYMTNAGFELNSDGFWTKDNEVLSLSLTTTPDNALIKLAQLIQEQYKDFGIDIQISTIESAMYSDTVIVNGDFDLALANWLYPEADIMYYIFHSSMINALNLHRLNDPELDTLLEQSRSETDDELRQEIVDQIQQYIVENAFIAPLYTDVNHYVVNSRIKDLSFSEQLSIFLLNDAYID